MEYSNLELIRKFSGCIDEHGFILVHVSMVKYSKSLVESALGTLEAVQDNDRLHFDECLGHYLDTLKDINVAMETMWKRSLHQKYMGFRTFIMGTKSQVSVQNAWIFQSFLKILHFVFSQCSLMALSMRGPPTNPPVFTVGSQGQMTA